MQKKVLIPLEREKAGLPPLDLCIAKYQFDEGWAMRDALCKKKIAAYLRSKINEYGQKVSKNKKDASFRFFLELG